MANRGLRIDAGTEPFSGAPIDLLQMTGLSGLISGSGSDYFITDEKIGRGLIAAIAIPRFDPVRTERKLLQIRLIAILKYVQRQRSEMQATMTRMIEAMMPATAVPLPVEVLQARQNAALRDAMFREFGGLTSAQIGEWAGSKSPNRAALAHRWKSDGRIFSVPHQGSNYFPGYQFDAEGQPRAVIADVIRVAGEKLAPWELAIWFIANDGWLGGRRPVDLLDSDPASVVIAAEHEVEEPYF